jgi:hypothetical protein
LTLNNSVETSGTWQRTPKRMEAEQNSRLRKQYNQNPNRNQPRTPNTTIPKPPKK